METIGSYIASLILLLISNCFRILFVIIREQKVDPEANEMPLDLAQRIESIENQDERKM